MSAHSTTFKTALPQKDVVVFIIGMKARKPWRLWAYLSASVQMFLILRDLKSSPQKGLLHTITLPNLLIQYWASYDHLYEYAIDPQSKHLGAWKRFNAKIKKTRAVGVFHETYVVPMDRVETAYFNMPPIGLSAVCQTAPFGKGTMTARQRLGVTAKTSTR